jgi:ABC-type phosphate transport system permease subunit
MEPHPGIQISKIPVKGVMGAVFAVGVVLMLLVGLPPVRGFLLISAPIGVIIGVFLYTWRKRKPVEIADIDPPAKN